MKYSKVDYKYKLENEYPEMFALGASFSFREAIMTEYITLKGGVLYIQPKYAWNGASGPVIDSKKNMRASLCHDALYQLMREGHVNSKLWKQADKEAIKVLRKDGVTRFIRYMWKIGLTMANGRHARPTTKEIYTAP